VELLGSSPVVYGREVYRTMPSIALRIELYNQAYRLAWPYVSDNKIQGTHISRLLDDAIQRRIRVGETDPVKIASAAVTELQQRYQRTPAGGESLPV
jgi:hypothetical protein